MAKPTSDVHICNLALQRLGQKRVTSVETPTTPNGDACKDFYKQTLRECLEQGVWPFASLFAQLTVDGIKEPAYGYANAFALPNDFVRLLTLGDHTINADTPSSLFDMSEGYIFTDEEDDTSTINIQYIADSVPVAKYSPLFIKFLYLQLAQNMAHTFTLKPSLSKALADELREVRDMARSIAGQQKKPRHIVRSRIRDVRRMGGFSRDVTRNPF